MESPPSPAVEERPERWGESPGCKKIVLLREEAKVKPGDFILEKEAPVHKEPAAILIPTGKDFKLSMLSAPQEKFSFSK